MNKDAKKLFDEVSKIMPKAGNQLTEAYKSIMSIDDVDRLRSIKEAAIFISSYFISSIDERIEDLEKR